mmetsp:Transcript_26114/g.23109  ORF Transcript_26114/g.23109 Transcript_26114/m.23109 type:complete len:119 (+) Transcript_26114:1108-1464(+)
MRNIIFYQWQSFNDDKEEQKSERGSIKSDKVHSFIEMSFKEKGKLVLADSLNSSKNKLINASIISEEGGKLLSNTSKNQNTLTKKFRDSSNLLNKGFPSDPLTNSELKKKEKDDEIGI